MIRAGQKRPRSAVPTLDGEAAEEPPLITYSHQTLGAVLVQPGRKQAQYAY